MAYLSQKVESLFCLFTRVSVVCVGFGGSFLLNSEAVRRQSSAAGAADYHAVALNASTVHAPPPLRLLLAVSSLFGFSLPTTLGRYKPDVFHVVY